MPVLKPLSAAMRDGDRTPTLVRGDRRQLMTGRTPGIFSPFRAGLRMGALCGAVISRRRRRPRRLALRGGAWRAPQSAIPSNSRAIAKAVLGAGRERPPVGSPRRRGASGTSEAGGGRWRPIIQGGPSAFARPRAICRARPGSRRRTPPFRSYELTSLLPRAPVPLPEDGGPFGLPSRSTPSATAGHQRPTTLSGCGAAAGTCAPLRRAPRVKASRKGRPRILVLSARPGGLAERPAVPRNGSWGQPSRARRRVPPPQRSVAHHCPRGLWPRREAQMPHPRRFAAQGQAEGVTVGRSPACGGGMEKKGTGGRSSSYNGWGPK